MFAHGQEHRLRKALMLDRGGNMVAAGARHTVFVPEPERLQKFTGRFPDENLFGSLTHTWLYDPVLVQLDRPGGSAWLVSDERDVPRTQLWALIRDLSPLPLLDHWRDPLLDGLGDRLCMPLSRFKFPPLGKVGCVRVPLEERFQDIVSMAVKQGVLTLEADDLAADAAGRIRAITDGFGMRFTSFFLSLRRSYDDYVGRRNSWGSSPRPPSRTWRPPPSKSTTRAQCAHATARNRT